MFDHQYFKDHELDIFLDRAERAARDTAGCRRGKDVAAEDLAQGYIDGRRHDDTVAHLDDRRIDAQRQWKPISDAYREKATRQLEHAFRFDIDTASKVAPLLNVLGSDEGAYKSLAAKYAHSYTALRAIADTAIKNGVGYGTELGSALDDYRSTCEEQLLGIADTADNGVLGLTEKLRIPAETKWDRINRAQLELHYLIGRAERPRDAAIAWLQDAVSEHEWTS